MSRGIISEGDVAKPPNVGGYNMFNSLSDFAIPSYMYKNALKSNGMVPYMTTAENEDNRIGPIVSEVLVAALTDGSQMTLKPGDYLFVYNPNSEVKKDSVILNLQTLNYFLEKAYRDRISNRPLEKTRKRQLGLDTFNFPITISEFLAQISFIGIMIGSDSQKNVRNPTISYGMKGMFRELANIFGPLNYGDNLELRVRAYRNTYNKFIDFNGVGSSNPTEGNFLQVRPFINRETIHPIIHHKAGVNDEEDLDFLEPINMRQLILEEPANTTDLFKLENNTGRRYTVSTTLPTEGISYILGRVLKCKKQPYMQTCLNALRSPTYMEELGKKHMTIDLYLDITRQQLNLGIMEPTT